MLHDSQILDNNSTKIYGNRWINFAKYNVWGFLFMLLSYDIVKNNEILTVSIFIFVELVILQLVIFGRFVDNETSEKASKNLTWMKLNRT
jgi:hypothetical protein